MTNRIFNLILHAAFTVHFETFTVEKLCTFTYYDDARLGPAQLIVLGHSIAGSIDTLLARPNGLQGADRVITEPDICFSLVVYSIQRRNRRNLKPSSPVANLLKP